MSSPVPRVLSALTLLSVVVVVTGCDRSPPPAAGGPVLVPRVERSAPRPAPGPFHFEDLTDGSGVDFVHVSGMTPQKLFPSANGSGVAVFDYDGDGRPDLYFATGNALPLGPRPERSNRLYRNLGGWKFQDVTEASGLGFRGYCHGITTGDLDNDGDPDVFLSNYGGDALFINNGDGTFTDVSQAAGILSPGAWTSSAAFLDFDGDGRLDLYASRYGDWQYPRDDRWCGDPVKKVRRYCSPKELTPVRHVLFRNLGGHRFEDATESSGVGRTDGHGFAAVAADLNGDGATDLYVANDQDPNFLFLNRGDGAFTDATLDSGAAYDADGKTQSGMGADVEDLDGDGRPELFVTNFQEEYNTLYRNLGKDLFVDATAVFGLAVDSLPLLGWGCALVDLDNDGWVDVVVANSHIDDNAELHGQPSEYAMPPLLHQNLGGKRFRTVSQGSGAYFESRHVGHGLAVGDLDDDGDLDLVFSHKDGPPTLLRNDPPEGAPASHWIRLKLRGTRSNRDGIGARLVIEAGGRTIHRLRKSGHGLMSSNDPRILVGLGPAPRVDRLTVHWPSGATSRLERPEVGRTLEVVEPNGQPPDRAEEP